MAVRFFRHPPADCDISPEGKYVTDSRFGKGLFALRPIPAVRETVPMFFFRHGLQDGYLRSTNAVVERGLHPLTLQCSAGGVAGGAVAIPADGRHSAGQPAPEPGPRLAHRQGLGRDGAAVGTGRVSHGGRPAMAVVVIRPGMAQTVLNSLRWSQLSVCLKLYQTVLDYIHSFIRSFMSGFHRRYIVVLK